MFIFILLSLLVVTLSCIAWLIHRNVSEKEYDRHLKEDAKDLHEALKEEPITPEHCLGARMTEKHAKFHDDLANCHFGMNELKKPKPYTKEFTSEAYKFNVTTYGYHAELAPEVVNFKFSTHDKENEGEIK